MNYEQIDATYLYQFAKLDVYAALGYVITPHAFRDRFMAELGFQARNPVTRQLKLSYGADVKIYEENNYSPDMHAGFGITISQKEKAQINFSLDVYHGQLPYSTLEFGRLQWYGLSTKIYL